MNFLRAWCLIAELVVSVDLVKLADLLEERTKMVDWLEELAKLVDLLGELVTLAKLVAGLVGGADEAGGLVGGAGKLVDFGANIAALGGCLLSFYRQLANW